MSTSATQGGHNYSFSSKSYLAQLLHTFNGLFSGQVG